MSDRRVLMTNEEFVAAWRAGQTVRVIEMGGLGKGYERCPTAIDEKSR